VQERVDDLGGRMEAISVIDAAADKG